MLRVLCCREIHGRVDLLHPLALAWTLVGVRHASSLCGLDLAATLLRTLSWIPIMLHSIRTSTQGSMVMWCRDAP